MSLIMAQGAAHVNQDRLHRIVDQINREIEVPPAIPLGGLYEKSLFDYNCDIRSIRINISPRSYAVEEKYDGYSYLCTGGRFFSKSLSSAKETKGMPVEKSDHVPHLTQILKSVYEICGADLHGELYKVGGTSDNVTRIMGCTADKAILRQAEDNEKLRYMLIDIRSINGLPLINEPHRLRRAILTFVYKKYIEPIDPNHYIHLTQEFVDTDPQVVFRSIVTRGGEGIMIKDENGLYIPGKKPIGNWIKGKKKITHDVFMVGFNEGTGKNENLFGSIRFAHMVDGKQVECGNCSSGLADDMREHIYRNADKMIENKQVFEIEAIQESVKSFRNAVFLRLRDDKAWNECKPELIRVKEDLI